MSHAATYWAIKQRGLKPATKLVLWHLCDRHNPDRGSFPSQERLAADCEMARSTVQRHIEILVAARLVKREQKKDAATHRQLPTRYFFPFEPEFDDIADCAEADREGAELSGSRDRFSVAASSPQNAGGGCGGGDPGRDRKQVAEPRPKKRQSRDRKNGKAVTDSYRSLTCKEPVKNLAREGGAPDGPPSRSPPPQDEGEARFAVKWAIRGSRWNPDLLDVVHAGLPRRAHPMLRGELNRAVKTIMDAGGPGAKKLRSWVGWARDIAAGRPDVKPPIAPVAALAGALADGRIGQRVERRCAIAMGEAAWDACSGEGGGGETGKEAA